MRVYKCPYSIRLGTGDWKRNWNRTGNLASASHWGRCESTLSPCGGPAQSAGAMPSPGLPGSVGEGRTEGRETKRRQQRAEAMGV